MPWQWSQGTSRYRDPDTGRFLPAAKVRDWLTESLVGSGNVTETLASFVGSDPPTISPTDWKAAMRREVKDEYIRQYLLGRGGRDQMTAVDWGSVGGMLRNQYAHLDAFFGQVDAGELTEGQIRARSRMYTNSARQSYERANERVQVEAGMRWVRWVLNAQVENCPDCIAFAAMGWVLVTEDPFSGCTPGSGCTVCLTNCACHQDYREEEPDEVARALVEETLLESYAAVVGGEVHPAMAVDWPVRERVRVG